MRPEGDLPASGYVRVKRIAGICVDGLPFVGVGVLLTILGVLILGKWAGLPLGLLTLWTIWFFRDPERTVPSDPNLVVSPADGKVIDVRRTSYPRLLAGEATRVSVFMSVFNVHVNRSPCSGRVRSVQYNPGKYLAAFAEKASLDNEQCAILIDTDRGLPVMFVQIAGLIARRIVCRLAPGESVNRGERFGLIRFGSRCDIYLPDGADVLVRVGDKVHGGSGVIGRFR
ncbi:MAG TPA: phosphatidylserine decarboxylase family protein [Bdellovibrionota bacterium]|nr:phosphatidylserine decarboxylase family protein [Bdellovibrionota bacterium]